MPYAKIMSFHPSICDLVLATKLYNTCT